METSYLIRKFISNNYYIYVLLLLQIQNAARYFKKTMHSHFGLALRFHLSEILAVGIALGGHRL